MAASLRFRAGVHACAGVRIVADLCAFAVAGCGPGHAGPSGACGDFFLWPDSFEFYRPFAARGESRGEELFLRLGSYLILYAFVVTGTLYYQASGHYQQGEWSDLPWTIMYASLILLAGTWERCQEEDGKKASRSPAACNFWRSSLRC